MLGLDPRSVAEFLGHADKSLVMRTYAHVMSGHAERAASLLTPYVTLSAKQEPEQGAPVAEAVPDKAETCEVLLVGRRQNQPAVEAGPDKAETMAEPERRAKKIKRRRKLRAG